MRPVVVPALLAFVCACSLVVPGAFVADGAGALAGVQTTPMEPRVTSASVRVLWHVTPVDPALQVQLERTVYTFPAQEWVTVGAMLADTGDVRQAMDNTVVPYANFVYRLSWSEAGITRYSTDVLNVETPVAPYGGSAQAHPTQVELSWPIFMTKHFVGWLERANAGGEYTRLAALDTLTETVVRVDRSVTDGQSYRYRLGWLELGDSIRTAPVVAAVPAVSVSLLDAHSDTGAFRLRWRVDPPDSTFVPRIERRPEPGSAWSVLGDLRLGAGTVRTFADSSAVVGRRYAYRLSWGAGSVSAPEMTVQVSAPALQFTRRSPNPTRGAMLFAYSLPAAGRASLALFDLQGRVVASASQDGPGWFAWAPSTSGLRAGLYMARLSFSGRSLTQRIVLVR